MKMKIIIIGLLICFAMTITAQAIPGYPIPTDPDGDGIYEDLNGNEIFDYDDVVVYYDNMEWIEKNMPRAPFDFNHNGLIDFDDVVCIYDML